VSKIKVVISPRTYYVFNGINYTAGQVIEVEKQEAALMVKNKLGILVENTTTKHLTIEAGAIVVSSTKEINPERQES
jgi:hypothetical protein